MSRVVYTDTPSTVGQDDLRVAHGVRIVAANEEGTGVNALPEGVYGFTYSPGLSNAPLFAERRYHSYETHKVAGGEIFIIGFTTPEVQRQLALVDAEVSFALHPEPEADATALVPIPYSRIQKNRQHAAPNQRCVTLTVRPA